ncbi:MAG TPA: IS1 family transposase [Solimonas sp.]|nr:IS1 family transposase [Solimonas sp.]
MNRMPLAKRAQILGMLVEGNSLRATARMADCSLNTVTKLLLEVGAACEAYQDDALRNLKCKRVQADEIWSFVYAKAKNAPGHKKVKGQAGDCWTWTALCADSKLIVSWMVGDRNASIANRFMADVSNRLADRVQLTTDGHKVYINAVSNAFGQDIDYAMLVKVYGAAGDPTDPARRYSPGECCGTETQMVCGNPDEKHISTSFVERQNLTMRMGMRRFTRLTNGFSKKVENHCAAIALHFMHYNFGRVHKTLRVTPAMEAGVAGHVWTLAEIAALVPGPVASKRGPYKPRDQQKAR